MRQHTFTAPIGGSNSATPCVNCGQPRGANVHTPAMIPTMINGRWELLLPAHRHLRPEWPWWEAQRLAAEHHVVEELIARNDQRRIDEGRPLAGWAMSSERRPLVYCVGAEEGDFPALYASWGANVVLFEPNERVWPNIKAIFEANRLEDRVMSTFVGFAGSSDRLEHLPPYVDRIWPPCADGAVIGDHGFCNLWERPDIPSMTIDTCVAQGEQDHPLGRTVSIVPDMITIDVEGAELEVLRGALETLRDHKPAVFVSIHPEFMRDGYNQHPDELHHWMRRLGYESRFLCTDHEQHWFFQHPDNRRMRLE